MCGYSVVALVLVCGVLQAQVPSPTPQAASPTPHAVDFVEIPGGPFTMGADRSSDALAFDNERWSPAAGQGMVDVPSFFIARQEVTVAQFSAFARASGWTVDPRAINGPEAHPAAFVSWPDALAYCRWLEASLKASSTTPAPIAAALQNGWRVTLPTEAQWEKAARGSDGRIFPWGNEPRRDRAQLGADTARPVGQTACPECAYGLDDMAGNVWEWTRSPYQPYPYDESNDRANLEADALWVMRGGGFADGVQLARATTRGAAEPGARRPFIGFRVVISPK